MEELEILEGTEDSYDLTDYVKVGSGEDGKGNYYTYYSLNKR